MAVTFPRASRVHGSGELLLGKTPLAIPSRPPGAKRRVRLRSANSASGARARRNLVHEGRLVASPLGCGGGARGVGEGELSGGRSPWGAQSPKSPTPRGGSAPPTLSGGLACRLSVAWGDDPTASSDELAQTLEFFRHSAAGRLACRRPAHLVPGAGGHTHRGTGRRATWATRTGGAKTPSLDRGPAAEPPRQQPPASARHRPASLCRLPPGAVTPSREEPLPLPTAASPSLSGSRSPKGSSLRRAPAVPALAQSCRVSARERWGQFYGEAAEVHRFQQHRWGDLDELPKQLLVEQHRKSSEKDPLHHDAGLSDAPDLDGFEAFELAAKFNLPSGSVTQAWRVFRQYDSTQTGRLTQREFELVLRAMMRERYPSVEDMPREMLEWRATAPADGRVGFDEFLIWVTQHAFTEELLLTNEQRKIRALARRYQVSVPSVEAIKEQFDRFDTDKSGWIDFEEFAKLLATLVCTKELACTVLPDSRIKAFWREIDLDGSGEVDFAEFIPWYLRYFDVSGCPVGTSPIEEFYANICPIASSMRRRKRDATFP